MHRESDLIVINNVPHSGGAVCLVLQSMCTSGHILGRAAAWELWLRQCYSFELCQRRKWTKPFLPQGKGHTASELNRIFMLLFINNTTLRDMHHHTHWNMGTRNMPPVGCDGLGFRVPK